MKRLIAFIIVFFSAIFIISSGIKQKVTIAIQPFSGIDAKLCSVLRDSIAHSYCRFGNVEISVLQALPLPKGAYYKPRGRYRADILLDYLDTLGFVSGFTKVIGLTDKDISTTKGKIFDWGIFGLGSMAGSSCVVSSFRLKRNAGERLFIWRFAQVCNHELGHTFGLEHCPSPGCLMADAEGTIKTVDKSKSEFCDKCKKELLNALTMF